MMKKLVIAFVVLSGLAFAGPGKTLTYPILHAGKSAHAVTHAAKKTGKAAAKATGKTAKALIW